MSLSSLTVADLRQIEKLVSRKERLLNQISEIDHELLQFEGGAGGAANGNYRGAARGGRGGGVKRRGEMKRDIISLLKKAGKAGLHIKEIVRGVGSKENNVRVWFYATGKKIKNIKRVKAATYRWEE